MDLTLQEVQNLSDLRKQVVTRASLPLVKLAYELDPGTLTSDVMCDAIECGASIDVIRFLVTPEKLRAYMESKRRSNDGISFDLSEIFLATVRNLEPGEKLSEEYLSILYKIIEEFPEAILNSNPDSYSEMCPFTTVLTHTSFPNNLLQFMAGKVPTGTSEFLFRFHEMFAPKSLDDDDMEAIRTVLNRVDAVKIERDTFTVDEFAKFLAVTMKSTVKKIIFCAETSSFEHIVGPALKQLERTVGQFPFTDFSSFLGPWDFPNDSQYFPCLVRLVSNLDRFHLIDGHVNQFTCDALSAMVRGGKLTILEVEFDGFEKEGMFLTLLEAINSSDTLTDVRLSIDKHSEDTLKDVSLYHDAILTILEHNTQLEMVFVGQDMGRYHYKDKRDTREHMRRHVNEERFLKQKGGDSKQRQIDYLTMLNICGRGKAKPECTSLVDFVKLLDMETLRHKLAFLQFEGQAEEDLINMMQFGLLRQEPNGWLGIVSGLAP